MFNSFKRAIAAASHPSGPPKAVWRKHRTNFEGMEGPARLASNLPTKEACFRELKLAGYRESPNPSFTSKGLEWERRAEWGAAQYLNIPNESHSLAVVDVEPGSNMQRWEITAIFWDDQNHRVGD